MDNFNVPKKVNRHVLKALSTLSSGDRGMRIATSLIMEQVKHQMRNLVPVPNIESAIHRSLKNLSEIGLIERHGLYRYGIGRCCAAALPQQPTTQPNAAIPDRRMFRGSDPRRRSQSDLDPNLKRTHRASDEESLSGDDFDRTRKRLRSNNKQLRHTGRWAFLPRARQHSEVMEHATHLHAAIDTPLISQDLYSLHHPHKQLGNSELGAIRGSANFTLANLTPTPSLELSEITEGVMKIVDVRQIVETPPLQQQTSHYGDDDIEYEDDPREAAEEGVQTDDRSIITLQDSASGSVSGQQSKSSGAVAVASDAVKQHNDEKPNQMEKQSTTSKRALNTSNTTSSQKSSSKLSSDYNTLSYIK